MSTSKAIFETLAEAIRGYGVEVRLKDMDIEKPGEFDGLSITINPKHDVESATYYLAHSFGSIFQWSTRHEYAGRVFSEIRDARKERSKDPGRFEQALGQYRQFEETSSDHAVWMLGRIGHAESIEPYTVFFRADLEAMTQFHKTGKEPPWPEFFAEWRRKVAAGEVRVEPFHAKPVDPFQPVKIAPQEVLQEQD